MARPLCSPGPPPPPLLSRWQSRLHHQFAVGITSSLCGARDVAALQENVRAAREPLDRAVIAELNVVTQPLLEALGPGFDYYENPANDRTK